MINKDRVIKLTQELVRINSENPGGNESAIALYVKRYLVNLGLAVKEYEFKKGRSNIIATIPGTSHKKSLLITPHLDTVPAGNNWKIPPFSGRLINGRIYGLGATDCKCNLAVCLEVIRSLKEDKHSLGYDLVFAATADEEAGSDLGLIPLLKKGILRPNAALVLDADDFSVKIAQKGLVHLKVTLRGKKAHGAYPDRGVNAIDAAVNILSELKSGKRRYKKNKYLKPPTMNIGTIRGGDRVNVVADWCEFELDYRYLPGEDPKNIINGLKRIIRRHSDRYKVHIHSLQKDYSLDVSHPIVKTFVASLRKFGIKPRISGSEGATTITFFQDKKIPAMASGFGVDGCAHSIDEYVSVGNLYKGAEVLEHFLMNYKG